MTKPTVFETKEHPRTLILGVQSPFNPTKQIESYFEEFRNLVRSNGISYDFELYIKLREIDPVNFLTQGKMHELIELCAKENIEEIIVSEPLNGKQERNINKLTRCKVFDRTQLILEIFEKGATSAEGKIQVALAMINHKRSRLAGRGTFMSQQGGGIGMRGPGETQKDIDLGHLDHLSLKLHRDLKKLSQVRETQRKHRLSNKVPLICLIGYTNAGKSSIFNKLTKSSVLAEDKLFATLDTTTRELYIDKTKKGLLSDTVGFIQQLPHQLIEAFKATLDELQYAHLLLHVIDIADPNWQAHIATVNAILKELNVEKPILYVFNKIDKVDETQLATLPLHTYEPHVLVSTYTENGLEPLVEFLRNWKSPVTAYVAPKQEYLD
jgi:GTP-binding protein HflX